MKKILLLPLLLGGISCGAWGASGSVLTTRLDDRKAVYLSAPEFGAHGDGKADESAAIQSAIDKAEGHAREGIVFVPSGRYRLMHTVHVWPGVRIFGYGATRPVFLLADNTPGFQNGVGVMVMFTGTRPGGDPPQTAGFPSRHQAACRRTTRLRTPFRARFIRP